MRAIGKTIILVIFIGRPNRLGAAEFLLFKA